jgi:hypothetical protein
MKLSDIRKKVSKIRQLAELGDDEGAHAEEDELYVQLLTRFASEGSTLAKEALKARSIEFGRWCA